MLWSQKILFHADTMKDTKIKGVKKVFPRVSLPNILVIQPDTKSGSVNNVNLTDQLSKYVKTEI